MINDGAELAFVGENRFEKQRFTCAPIQPCYTTKSIYPDVPRVEEFTKRFFAHGCQMLHVGPLWLVDA